MELEEKLYADLLGDLQNNRLVLPTLPEVAFKVRKVVDDEDASAAQIAKIVATDPALTTRLLQVVNSPMYRGKAHIDNLQSAVSRLGIMLVRNLVISVVMKQLFTPKSPLIGRRLKALWEHSTQVAAICHVLAAQFTRLNPDQAMLAGLIHDIGAMPILAQAEKLPELLNDEALLDNVLHHLHTEVGGAILNAWGFAPELVAAVREHENLQRDPGGAPDYADVVIVANLQSYLGTAHRLAQTNWAEVPAFTRLGLDAQVSVIDMEGAGDNVKAMQQMLAG